ncbi:MULTISPECIES: hypothetical protein [Halomonadaceae]|uniref:Phage abortive infection protein n=1 Tax=Billgrantia aerodenitrificans TaxID=2733483 RepID=A0ABS9AZ91_9GAMM|nr:MULTISPECIES: hypothetical protein [Halomonas]MCE8027021.1 hypothetical protein [Halomonas aerodenitrificans]
MNSHKGVTRRAIINLVMVVFSLIFGVWLGAWYFGVQPLMRDFSPQPISDIFSSINALFAGLAFGGVILTIFLQIKELQETRDELAKTASANHSMAQANLAMAVHANEKSVLDLFQVYCSEYFQQVKDSSMSVLIPCVASRKYCEFVVSRFFVADQLPFPEESWDKIKRVTYCKTYDEFRSEEQRYRYKLDELINYFTLLAGQSNSSEVIRKCDFSYSWWRPLFWMLALLQEDRYEQNEEVRKYATPLYLRAVVEKLDSVYGFEPFANAEEAWQYILNHPKVKSYGVDELYSSS